jgi:hypothetical protein
MWRASDGRGKEEREGEAVEGQEGDTEVEGVPGRRIHEHLKRARATVEAGLLLSHLEQQQVAPAVGDLAQRVVRWCPDTSLPRNAPPAGSAPSRATGISTTWVSFFTGLDKVGASEGEDRTRERAREGVRRQVDRAQKLELTAVKQDFLC